MSESKNHIPKDGIPGLKENWKIDIISGFLVFLLALPLSLGIAKASEFPPAMGVLTAMIGGIMVSFFAGSRLTIKGPAAGLITICAGAVTEMGGGEQGWHLALGVIIVAALIQIVFGLLKFGSLSDFFPHSAVHGMLAAIGLIIISKQIHILLGIDPASLKGMEPLELFAHIPHSLENANFSISLIGIISLLILFGLPLVKIDLLKKIPAPMFVLLFAIPAGIIMDFKNSQPAFSLVKIGDFWASVGYNPDFSLIGTFVFWKYVFMFLFVNSLESLLTVKAIDGLDPWKRQSNPNKDLVAVGIGNSISGLLGGLPMISEVARSSANINFGGRTRWANFFHGFFLLVAMLILVPVIEMIPNTALAAMLIFVGYKLAAPKEFIHIYKIGKEQLAVFVTTVIVTLSTDLLIGILAGIIVEMLIHVFNGAPIIKGAIIISLFTFNIEVEESAEKKYRVKVKNVAVFSNFIGLKKELKKIPQQKEIILDFKEAVLVDHTVIAGLEHFAEEYNHRGGNFKISGLDELESFSKHPHSARKKRIKFAAPPKKLIENL